MFCISTNFIANWIWILTFNSPFVIISILPSITSGFNPTLDYIIYLRSILVESFRISRLFIVVFIVIGVKIQLLVRSSLLFYLYFPPSFHLTVVCFCPVGLSLLIQHFQQVLRVLKLLLSPGLGSFNTHKTCRKCCINNERPTGQKHTTVRWNDDGK